MNVERFDIGKKYVLSTIAKNNRLDTYSKYIEMAKQHGYYVCSMREFFLDSKEKKHFVLRHDVDYLGPFTRKMFTVERNLGVHSTYYFRDSTIDVSLMNEMIEAQFEVGFHYETLSNYAKEHSLNKLSIKDIEICRSKLKKEIQNINELLNSPITSVASHGDKKNREIMLSNNVLLEGQDYNDYGILFEAYDENLYNNYVDVHIMDNNIRRNFGFSYSVNPIEAISDNYTNIVFLSHPNHWYNSWKRIIYDMAAFLVGRYDSVPRGKFSRIMKDGIQNK